MIITLRQNQRIDEYEKNQKSAKAGSRQWIEENRRVRVGDRRRRDKSAIGTAKMPRRTVGKAEEVIKMERRVRESETARERV